MAKIISIINYKGGVGKTTVTLQLGIGLATIYNQKVLMVDLDPQCSLSLSTVDEYFWADWLRNHGSVINVISSFEKSEHSVLQPEWVIQDALDRSLDKPHGRAEGLDLLPSHLDLPDYEMQLMSREHNSSDNDKDFFLNRHLLLWNSLKMIHDNYDYILFDCPPNIYLVARNAILASDFFLVPTIPDFISCYGIPFILQHIKKMQEKVQSYGARSNASLLGILRNKVKQAGEYLVKEHEEHSKCLELEYGDFLFKDMIMDRIGIAELLSSRKNVFSSLTEKTQAIRHDFSAVIKTVFDRTHA